MFNENDKSQYEYHYSYQPVNPAEPAAGPEVTPPAKQKKNNGGWKRFVAGLLCGVLVVGGAFAGGWFAKHWADQNQVNHTAILYSQRP